MPPPSAATKGVKSGPNISYENAFFNNTAFNFVRGSRRQAPQAGRVKVLGNVWQSMGLSVFRDADPARTAPAGNEADAGPRRNLFAIETDAYARNVFHEVGTGEGFGVFESTGRWHKSLPQAPCASMGRTNTPSSRTKTSSEW